MHPVLFNLSRSVDTVSVETVNRPPGCHQILLREVVGSCNGLVALSHKFEFTVYDWNVIIWNPLTAKFKEICAPAPHAWEISYGFGYDPKIDDYKLVRIAMLYDSNRHPNQLMFRAAVYSLKSDSWKYIGKRWCLNCGEDSWQKEGGVLVNNELHWGVFDEEDDEENRIVAFDLVKESFRFLPVPKCVKGHSFLKLSVFDGCLTLSSEDDNGIFVWILEDDGVKKSWTRLLYVDRTRWLYFDRCSGTLVPLAYSRDGDKILLNYYGTLCDLHWYDLSTGDRVECGVNRNEVKRRGDVKTFIGSLVSPDESQDWIKLKRKQQSIDMKRKMKRTREEESIVRWNSKRDY